METDVEFTSSLNKPIAIRYLFKSNCVSSEKLRQCIAVLYDCQNVYFGLPPAATNVEIKSSGFEDYTKPDDKIMKMTWTPETTASNVSKLVKTKYVSTQCEKNKNLRFINAIVQNKMVIPYMELGYVQGKIISNGFNDNYVLAVHLTPESKWMLSCFTNNFERIYGEKIVYDSCNLKIKRKNMIGENPNKMTVQIKIFKMGDKLHMKLIEQ